MLRLTPRLTPGCTITDLATLPVLMDMVTMAIIWVTLVWVTVVMGMAIIWAMLGMDMVIIWDITARGPPRLNQLLRLMLRLPQRLTHGCTITDLATLPVLMDMVTMAIIWA